MYNFYKRLFMHSYMFASWKWQAGFNGIFSSSLAIWIKYWMNKSQLIVIFCAMIPLSSFCSQLRQEEMIMQIYSHLTTTYIVAACIGKEKWANYPSEAPEQQMLPKIVKAKDRNIHQN